MSDELIKRLRDQANTLDAHAVRRKLWPGDNDFSDAARSMREAADALEAAATEAQRLRDALTSIRGNADLLAADRMTPQRGLWEALVEEIDRALFNQQEGTK
jgi:signal transduction histidine kinase